MAQERNGRRVNIFGIFLADTLQVVKEAGELREEDDDGTPMKSPPANR
jgi:hypothetical protein